MNVDTDAWGCITREWAHTHPLYALLAIALVYLPLATAWWLTKRVWRIVRPALKRGWGFAWPRLGARATLALDRLAEAVEPQPDPAPLLKRLPPRHGVAEQPRMEAYAVAHREVVAFADIRDANREWAARVGAAVWADHEESGAAQSRPPRIRAIARVIRTRTRGGTP